MRMRQSGKQMQGQVSDALRDAITAVLENEGKNVNLDEDLDRPVPKDTQRNPFNIVDIITFCEHPYFLGEKLYPWQKVIMKVFYMGQPGNTHLRLNDSTEGKCEDCVWHKNRLGLSNPCLACEKYSNESRENFLARQIEINMNSPEEIAIWREETTIDDKFLNELQMFYKDLPNQIDEETGRVIDSEESLVREQVLSKLGKRFVELVLVLGRRSGKSLLTSIIALYEAYQLISMGDPHKHYNLLGGDPISILNVAVSEQQAKESIFEKIKAMALNSPYFADKVNSASIRTQSIRFYTDADKEKNEEMVKRGLSASFEGSIQVLSGTSSASSQVGKTLACVIIDEMAEMLQNEGSKMSDDALYEKLKPSIATFAPYGKIISISNPLLQRGKLWELYNHSFEDDSILMFQLPTQLTNPSIDKEWLAGEFRRDPAAWMMHYGAKFNSGSLNPLIPPEMIDDAFLRGNFSRKIIGNPSIPYYAHADAATNSDMYAFCILHSESCVGQFGRQKVVVDHIQVWDPTPGKPVNIEEVDAYILEMCKKFNVVSLTYDQWQSVASIQKMQKNKIPAKQTSFTRGYKEKIYGQLLDLFINNLIDIYSLGAWSSEAQIQLKNLQKKFNMNSFRIEATKGFHDDIPSCIAGAAYMCLQGSVAIKLPQPRLARLGFDALERISPTYTTNGRRGKEF